MNRQEKPEMDWRRNQEAFTHRLEKAMANQPYYLQANIRPPRDFNFAHGVLSGYVTGLSREEK